MRGQQEGPSTRGFFSQNEAGRRLLWLQRTNRVRRGLVLSESPARAVLIGCRGGVRA